MNRSVLVTACLLCAAGTGWSADAMQDLLATYKTAPQGYPKGKDERGIPYAQPDTSSWFRWHFYHEGALERFDDAEMVPVVHAYNALEGEAVQTAQRSPVQFAFVAEHATAGKQALKVTFPAAAIQAGQACVQICPEKSSPTWVEQGCALGSNYRWVEIDVFNPGAKSVQAQVAGVPFVLPPGASVVRVKTADASGYAVPVSWPDLGGAHRTNPANFCFIPVTVVNETQDVVLYLDHLRMTQEQPKLLTAKGRFIQFGRMAWPGAGMQADESTDYTPDRGYGWTAPKKKRQTYGLNSRSLECALIQGRVSNPDAPFRVDVPNGRYGIHIWATPASGHNWEAGMSVKVNGQAQPLLAGMKSEAVRTAFLSGEDWDYRPGYSLWESLVRPAYFPATQPVYAEVTEGFLGIELPPSVTLRTIAVFPEGDKAAALKELGRLNFLLAEAWDVCHSQVKGEFAARARYIGFHEEQTRPEAIPGKLEALKLQQADFTRGYKTFLRGLTEAVYPDTVPSPEEASAAELSGAAAPGERECLTLGLLPLRAVKDVEVKAEALQGPAGAIAADRISVRWGRMHQKCMEYGHHNHQYNLEPHYLVKRAKLDLHPAAARRIYLDLDVPPEAKPGAYEGALLVSAEGKTLRVPVKFQVRDIRLETPPVFYGTEGDHPELQRFGINLASCSSYDSAAEKGFKAYAAWPYDAVGITVKGKRLGWGGFIKEQETVKAVLEAGQTGKGPRCFFGGPMPPDNRDLDPQSPFWLKLKEALPGLDVPGLTMPVYFFLSPCYAHSGYVWQKNIPTYRKPELLEQAAAAGKPFWFADWLRHSKEQPARFTFGFWLWRLGAMGRFSTFTAGGDYGYGTAREAYGETPYYTLLGVVGGSNCPALHPSQEAGKMNPSRDLLLIREGIDDYRYIYTLETLLRAAEGKAGAEAALAKAKEFRDRLRAELSLDLAKFYECRRGAYAENWYPLKENPWIGGKFEETRRGCAEHIAALQKVLGK